jgi:DNA-binding MarR family transcriptional regulator
MKISPRKGAKMAEANQSSETIYEYIKQYIKAYAISPTVDEITAACKVAKSTTSYHLDKLEAEGRIARQWYKARSIRLTEGSVNSDEITEEVYDLIIEGIQEEGQAPSQREIAAACHISRPTVQMHLKRLQARGRIQLGAGHRQIFVVKDK